MASDYDYKVQASYTIFLFVFFVLCSYYVIKKLELRLLISTSHKVTLLRLPIFNKKTFLAKNVWHFANEF